MRQKATLIFAIPHCRLHSAGYQMKLALQLVFRFLGPTMNANHCPGCPDPREFDNISWITMPKREYNRILDNLGTCELCRAELDMCRSKLALAAVCKHH